MRALVDAVEKYLDGHINLTDVTVKAFGPTFEIPEELPYINVLPRGKPRERQFLVGSSPLYEVNPEIVIEVWEQSIDSLRDAFEKCETLAEKVLDALAGLSASNLGVNVHEEQIETFDPAHYEAGYLYLATILMKATMDESYS